MTRRQELERHRQSLGEIRNIMNSMKTLAYMETRKLSRFLQAQQAKLTSIEGMAADFLAFYPDTLPQTEPARHCYLLMGSERGFCGDFNQALLAQLEQHLASQEGPAPLLIAIGHKLHNLLQDDHRVQALLEGVTVAEEVIPLLNRVVQELSQLQQQTGLLAVSAFYYEGEQGIVSRTLLPPFEQYRQQAAATGNPPLLNLSPQEFLTELSDHYLFAVLNEMIYTSLMAENQQRVSHLEGAIKHLDEETLDMSRRCNALRQEEIIEEIEVILLSSTSEDKSNTSPREPSSS